MAFAMVFPDPAKLKRKAMFPEETSDAGFNKATLSKARFVLRNSPMVEGDRYPGRCLDVMNGLISLTEAYELAQQDFKDREKKEREAKEIAAKRADLEACRSSIQ
jgi:hypothetical protein